MINLNVATFQCKCMHRSTYVALCGVCARDAQHLFLRRRCRRRRLFSIPLQIFEFHFKSNSYRIYDIVSVPMIIFRFAGYTFSALLTNDKRYANGQNGHHDM